MKIQVGRLGKFVFDPGWYIYTGSAMGSLSSRLERHLHGPASGRLRWHIDYLAHWGVNKQCRVLPPGTLSECELNAAVANIRGATMPVKKFGSSDCRCISHLHRLPRAAWPKVEGLRNWKTE